MQHAKHYIFCEILHKPHKAGIMDKITRKQSFQQNWQYLQMNKKYIKHFWAELRTTALKGGCEESVLTCLLLN